MTKLPKNSKQNTCLLSYRKEQCFRITCTVLVTNCTIMFWRQVPAYKLSKTLLDINPDRKVCLCFTEGCYCYISHSNASSLTHSLQPILGTLTGLKSLLLSETTLFQVQYYSYLCKAITKINQTTVTVLESIVTNSIHPLGPAKPP